MEYQNKEVGPTGGPPVSQHRRTAQKPRNVFSLTCSDIKMPYCLHNPDIPDHTPATNNFKEVERFQHSGWYVEHLLSEGGEFTMRGLFSINAMHGRLQSRWRRNDNERYVLRLWYTLLPSGSAIGNVDRDTLSMYSSRSDSSTGADKRGNDDMEVFLKLGRILLERNPPPRNKCRGTLRLWTSGTAISITKFRIAFESSPGTSPAETNHGEIRREAIRTWKAHWKRESTSRKSHIPVATIGIPCSLACLAPKVRKNSIAADRQVFLLNSGMILEEVRLIITDSSDFKRGKFNNKRILSTLIHAIRMPFIIYVPHSNRPYLTEISTIASDCHSWGWQVESRSSSDSYTCEIQRREKQLKQSELRISLLSVWSHEYTRRLGLKSTDTGRVYSRRKSLEEEAFGVPETFFGFQRMRPARCNFQPLETWLKELEELLPALDVIDAAGRGDPGMGMYWLSCTRDRPLRVKIKIGACFRDMSVVKDRPPMKAARKKHEFSHAELVYCEHHKYDKRENCNCHSDQQTCCHYFDRLNIQICVWLRVRNQYATIPAFTKGSMLFILLLYLCLGSDKIPSQSFMRWNTILNLPFGRHNAAKYYRLSPVPHAARTITESAQIMNMSRMTKTYFCGTKMAVDYKASKLSGSSKLGSDHWSKPEMSELALRVWQFLASRMFRVLAFASVVRIAVTKVANLVYFERWKSQLEIRAIGFSHGRSFTRVISQKQSARNSTIWLSGPSVSLSHPSLREPRYRPCLDVNQSHDLENGGRRVLFFTPCLMNTKEVSMPFCLVLQDNGGDSDDANHSSDASWTLRVQENNLAQLMGHHVLLSSYSGFRGVSTCDIPVSRCLHKTYSWCTVLLFTGRKELLRNHRFTRALRKHQVQELTSNLSELQSCVLVS
ncbi:uncharacterized protein BDR25DRAFT_358318 [Lindgomyces ingoldianus]|uniref:Uncharacterized protein n=1 Tax=Lindgomyces ingoldianus TaxID=673940 RepID=A0ACB6QND5_9PLEO|nr:uncharacterized protein BDR25DRAFT_358318 [Lindgomyces ingoldianus]KAF2467632.1 hypothetical protein BDR25DRAFT_358318 [Lindgomyces ingoldianus]